MMTKNLVWSSFFDFVNIWSIEWWFFSVIQYSWKTFLMFFALTLCCTLITWFCIWIGWSHIFPNLNFHQNRYFSFSVNFRQIQEINSCSKFYYNKKDSLNVSNFWNGGEVTFCVGNFTWRNFSQKIGITHYLTCKI